MYWEHLQDIYKKDTWMKLNWKICLQCTHQVYMWSLYVLRRHIFHKLLHHWQTYGPMILYCNYWKIPHHLQTQDKFDDFWFVVYMSLLLYGFYQRYLNEQHMIYALSWRRYGNISTVRLKKENMFHIIELSLQQLLNGSSTTLILAMSSFFLTKGVMDPF